MRTNFHNKIFALILAFTMRFKATRKRTITKGFLLWTALLWTAPEHLRITAGNGRSQLGDVYSYAIILQEIALREKPFSTSLLSPKGECTAIFTNYDGFKRSFRILNVSQTLIGTDRITAAISVTVLKRICRVSSLSKSPWQAVHKAVFCCVMFILKFALKWTYTQFFRSFLSFFPPFFFFNGWNRCEK